MVATRSVKSYVDSSETYLAISIQTPNRNEVQILQLSTKNVICNFELDSEDQISSISWSQISAPSKSKKRSRKDEKLSNKQNSCYLIVALEQGDILVFSPFQKDVVNKISNDSKIISLFACNDHEFYGLDISGQIKQFPLLENKLIKSYAFNDDKALKLISQHTGDEDFIITSNCVYIVEPTKSGFLDTTVRFPVPRGHPTYINSIVQSLTNPDILITSRDSDNTIHIYSKKVNTSILKASSNVVSLKLVNVSGVEYLVAILESGNVEIFKGIEEKRSKDDELTPFIKISSEMELDNVIISEQNGMESVWFEDFKPKFATIDLSKNEISIEAAPKPKTNGASEASVTTKLQIVEEDDDDEDDEDVDEQYDHEEESIENGQFVVSTSDELYSLLVAAIESNDDERIIEICKSENSTLNIKQTILKNVTLEQSVVLFNALSIRISGQPSDSTNISKWLKFLLLIHGNNIIKSENNVAVLNLLRSSLLESTKHLPNLVALQGRLQLLKSQLQLRNEMSSLSIDESEDDEEDEEEENAGEEEIHENEEGGFYINGEGDEDESFVDKDNLDAEDIIDEDED